jgi:hypothetical protein
MQIILTAKRLMFVVELFLANLPVPETVMAKRLSKASDGGR